MLLKDQIKEKSDIDKKTITIEQWDDIAIEVRSLSARKRLNILRKVFEPNSGQVDVEKMWPELLLSCCYDPETGEQLFEEKDLEWLMEKSHEAIELIVSAAMELSGLKTDSVKDAEKNLSEIPN